MVRCCQERYGWGGEPCRAIAVVAEGMHGKRLPIARGGHSIRENNPKGKGCPQRRRQDLARLLILIMGCEILLPSGSWGQGRVCR